MAEISENTSQKYKIELENRAVVTVNIRQLFKPRWINYFGSVDKVKEFIKNYK